ncbi:MAG: bifunctional 5,10-methylenetetrahydrofolate dehydrogenase/5,10-methenyltetrahydrofolate cyclohydrolase [Cuniculiplasma sp.]
MIETIIFDGRDFSRSIDKQTRIDIHRFMSIQGREPKLLIIDPTDSEEAQIYGRSKIRKANLLGIKVFPFKLSNEEKGKNPMETIETILSEIEPDGVIIERPYPYWLDSLYLENILPTYLDIEGITIKSQGRNMIGYPYIIPATAEAALRIILSLGDDHRKKVCIINRTTIIGRPLAISLLNRDFTVTVCHSKTRDLKSITRESDIIVTATGKPGFIDSTYIGEGAILIDVGITEKDGKIMGDVNLDSVKGKASFITPVPGGVGPVTTSVLMSNLMKATMDRIEERLNF